MEVNDKIAELEDELKLLKAEIRNVLLDIREVVLERKNPLGEEHESAFIRMDLNTTARAMAAEAAAQGATQAANAANTAGEEAPDEDGPPPDSGEPEATDPAADSDEPADEPGPVADELPAERAPEPASAPSAEAVQTAPAATAVRQQAPVDDMENTDIPQMFMADLAPLSGNGSLAEWVTHAIDNVGVEDLRRVITMFRLWGNVPPNISRALAHLQELLASSDDPRPAWLKVLQDLDRLASL